MLYRILADGVVLLHVAFVTFVVLGGFLVWRWRWVALVHVIPALYPAGLARPTQAVLGTLVLALNLVAYGVLLRRK